ncbi:uncharacterized protein VNE69_11007 [Vairimorpha necatrix]|uniref:Uncharacterized protein n=1 Tax=Vairimorpha necatrix TaxID=6039 RepID=A0AAX4JFS7_9MICR
MKELINILSNNTESDNFYYIIEHNSSLPYAFSKIQKYLQDKTNYNMKIGEYIKNNKYSEQLRHLKSLEYVNDKIYPLDKFFEKFFINFFIVTRNHFHFFKLDVRNINIDIFFINEIKKECKYNAEEINLYVKFFDLYNFYEIRRKSDFNTSETKYKTNELISIEYKDYKVIFNYMNYKTVFASNEDPNRSKGDYLIGTYVLADFYRIVEYLFETQKKQFVGLEFFFQLMKENDKVKYIINRILNKKDSAIGIIFSHIFFKSSLLDRTEIEDFNIYGLDIIKIIEDFITNTRNETTLLMKHCLFIETAEIINDNAFLEDSIFKIIKNLSGQESSHNAILDLMKLFEDLEKKKKFY